MVHGEYHCYNLVGKGLAWTDFCVNWEFSKCVVRDRFSFLLDQNFTTIERLWSWLYTIFLIFLILPVTNVEIVMHDKQIFFHEFLLCCHRRSTVWLIYVMVWLGSNSLRQQRFHEHWKLVIFLLETYHLSWNDDGCGISSWVP